MGMITETVEVVEWVFGKIAGIYARTQRAARAARAAQAQLLMVSWRSKIGEEDASAAAHNRSEMAFNDMTLTVGCARMASRVASTHIGFIKPNEDSKPWPSSKLHEQVGIQDDPRPAGCPKPEGDAATGCPEYHTVRATFSDNKGYWSTTQRGELKPVDSLVMWAEKTRADTLRRYLGPSSPFSRKYHLAAEVESFDRTEDLEHAFTTLARDGVKPPDLRIPDIVVGPHDWIGRVVEKDSVIGPPDTGSQSEFDVNALYALRHGNVPRAVPYVFDTVALIRNNKLAGRGPMPSTIDEVLDTGKSAMAASKITDDGVPLALQVGKPNRRGDAGDPYHMWPLFSSAGGSFFGLNRSRAADNHDGGDQWDDIGIWQEDFIHAFEQLSRLGVGRNGPLSPTLDRRDALDLFLNGRAPYFICSSGALASIKKHRLNVSVRAVPPLGEQEARSMVSVYGFFIYKEAPNQPAALDLLASYLKERRAGVDLQRYQQLVPVQTKAMSEVAGKDPILKPYVDQCGTGMIMPSYPIMREAWQLLGQTEYKVLAGDGDPHVVASAAAEKGWTLLEQARKGR